MNNIILGALLFFICSTGIFGYVSYQLSEQKGMAVQALQEAQDRLADSEKSLNLAYLSCKIDDTSVKEVEAEKKDLEAKNDAVSTQIEKLRVGTSNIPKPHVKQEIIKNDLKETNVLPDDGMLSANLVGMLREGFCQVEPTDSSCISSGQPSSESL